MMSGAQKVGKHFHGNKTKHTTIFSPTTTAVWSQRHQIESGLGVWLMLACHPNMIEICQDHVRKSVGFVSLLLEFATGCRFFGG